MKRLFLPILILVFVTSVYAQDADKVATETRIAKQSATETGDRGLFTVPSVETLNKGQFSAGFAWSNTDRTPRDLDINSLPAFISYGLLGRLTITGTFETQRQITARSLSQPGFSNLYPFVTDRYTKGFGDTTLMGKYRFQRRKDNIGGMSFRGFVKLGSTEQKKTLGTGAPDVGADVIFTSLLPLKFVMHSSIGYTLTGDAVNPSSGLSRSVCNDRPRNSACRGIKDQMRSGLGAAWPSSGRLQGIFEYSTITFVGAGSNNAASSMQSISDITGGLRWLMLNQGLTLNAGFRTNTKFDLTLAGNQGADRNGFTFSISYTKPFQPPGNNRFPVVSLETSAEQIRVGGSATITATGYDPDNDKLTYAWTTSGGQIAGSGESVTFNATGVAAGKYTIRVTASDGKGGKATSQIDVMVTP